MHSSSFRGAVAAASFVAGALFARALSAASIAQWDFDGDLSPATAGTADLVAEAVPPEVAPTFDFVEELIGGEEASVASFSRGTCFRMPHGLLPNGGGAFVNQYTLVLDVMFPDTAASGWASLWQTNAANANDGDWFVKSGAGVGISGNYGGVVEDGVWHRLALVVDLVAGTFTAYVDGVLAMENTGLALDGRWSLDPEAILFADEDQENSAGFVNSVQIRDVALTADEIEALGGPSASGIPLPANPRDCAFRGFAASFDPATGEVRGSWALLPGDGGFRVYEGARKIGEDLPASATSFVDATPPVAGRGVVYVLQGLVGGAVETECPAPAVDTFACPKDLLCEVDGASKTATLRWTPGANLGASGYEIRRDGEVVSTVAPDASSYADSLPGPGVYLYELSLAGAGPFPCETGALACRVGATGGEILFFEGFDGYSSDDDLLAAGWEVIEVNAPSENAAWTLTNPGRRGNPGTRDGRPSLGRFVVSDSDAASGDDHQGSGRSHDLVSPPFSAEGKSSVWLHLASTAILNNNGEVVFDIDVSADGGASWENVFRRVAPARAVEPLPTTEIPEGASGGPQASNADGVYGALDIDLSAVAAGERDVRIRFRQFEPSDDWWIAVDDLLVDTKPASGGTKTLLEEGFDSGTLPDDWWTESVADVSAPWDVADPCLVSHFLYNGGVFPDGADGRRLHRFGDSFAIVGYDPLSCVAVVQDEWLLTPVLDCSDAEEVFLQVRSSLLVTTAVAEILASVDSGKTFDEAHPVFTYNASDTSILRLPGNADVISTDHLLEVPAAAGKKGVVFAFRYANSAPDAGFWAIDDVKVTANAPGGGRPRFHRGDPNDDGQLNITDGIFVLNFLFLGGPEPTCAESADANNDGGVNITDGIFLLNFLFLGGPAPAAPGPPEEACGEDPDAAGSPGDLGCASYTKC